MVGTIIEATVMIIVLGLLLAHAGPFSQVVTSISGAYTGAVKSLSGVAGA